MIFDGILQLFRIKLNYNFNGTEIVDNTFKKIIDEGFRFHERIFFKF